MKNETSFLLL